MSEILDSLIAVQLSNRPRIFPMSIVSHTAVESEAGIAAIYTVHANKHG